MTNLLEIHNHSISSDFMENLTGNAPYQVQIRIKLNELGFKFKDDGDIKLILNKNPIPLGEMVSWYDPSTRKYHYRQTIRRYNK